MDVPNSPGILPFGVTPEGETVFQITLKNDTLCCQVLTFGATLRSLTVPDRKGQPVDVVLGFDSLKAYLPPYGYMGATVGRFANRICGGQFTLNGVTHTLAKNSGPNHLHGGKQGFSHRVWQVLSRSDTAVTLGLDSPHGEEGYPGHLQCRVEYALEGNALVIRSHAVTDRDTVCSLTNHSYFNLSGQGSGSVLEHTLQLFAGHYTPSDNHGSPIGTVAPVENTPMDFRSPTPVGLRLRDPLLRHTKGYDHNYVIDGAMGTLRPFAAVYAADTGITMEAETTLPGFQLYTGNYLPLWLRGKGGRSYRSHHGLCLETQFFPDSPNQPNFPSPILRAGEEYDHCTLFRFSCR